MRFRYSLRKVIAKRKKQNTKRREKKMFPEVITVCNIRALFFSRLLNSWGGGIFGVVFRIGEGREENLFAKGSEKREKRRDFRGESVLARKRGRGIKRYYNSEVTFKLYFKKKKKETDIRRKRERGRERERAIVADKYLI